MNLVFKKGSNNPLTPTELAMEANVITSNHPFTDLDFEGPNSRIQGSGHCDCGGNGEFDLLPLYDPSVREGGKRYMVCRKCGCYSHL